MTTPEPQLDHAILRLLKSVLQLPAEVTVYAATLSSIALIVTNTDPASLPPALATFAGGIGVNLVSNLMERLAQGEDLTDEHIRQTVQVALDQSPVKDVLTQEQFRVDLARLAGGLNLRLLKQAVEQGDRDLAQRLTRLYSQYDLLRSETGQGFEQVNNRLDALRAALDKPAPQVQQNIDTVSGGTVIGIQNNYTPQMDDPRVLEALARLEALLTPKPAETFEPIIVRHVFISYSRKDSTFADRLEAELNQRGINTWRDKHNIPGGMAWYQSIVTGLDNAYAMICVVSPHADESRWVLREQLYGDERGIPRLPVLIQPHRIPFHLIETQPIDCGLATFSVGVGQLVAFLRPLQAADLKVTTPPVADKGLDSDRLREEYLRFLLSESVADLRDALYVNLSATTEQARPGATTKSALAVGLDMELLFDLKQLGLEDIQGEDFDQRGQAVEDARQPIRDYRRVVLLGDPGAGKTTTLLKLVVDYARSAQADPAAILPVFVPLREFTGAVSFTAFVQEKLGILQEVHTQFQLVLLLDALNEMPRTATDGRDLVAEVRDFLRDKTDWVVSCRVRDYQDDLSALQGLGKVRIKPLDLPQIQEFITRFYASTPDFSDPQQGERLWQAIHGTDDLLEAWKKLHEQGKTEVFWGTQYPEGMGYSWESPGQAWNAMHRDSRRSLQLARNPYILTLICRLFGIAGQLPANRGALFQQFVGVLLKREETTAAQTGAVWLETSRIRQGLAQIAYALGAQTEMPRSEAERILQQHLPDTDSKVLLQLAVAASLIDVGAAVRFTHQLLQEYFASEVLGAMVDTQADPRMLWPVNRWWEPNRREETAIILAGVRGNPEGVARWLAPAQPELAYRVLTESGVPLNIAEMLPETRAALVSSAKAKADETTPIGRAAAYRVLGLLNADERPYIGLDRQGLPDIDWVDIPAGEFLMGSDKKKDSDAQDRETPQHSIALDSYQISRYPITYTQFQTFLDDPEGFANAAWWAGLAVDDDNKAQPGEQRYPYGNHPRENVSWYDAVAFCRWLSEKLGYEVRLPTEAEWEKAARGPDGLIYPYGDTFDANKANTGETGIKQTSAVGIFPDGASPYGVQDMSGNVWEWCVTKWRGSYGEVENNSLAEDDPRVLRGGAFNNFQVLLRAAYRARNDPDFHLRFSGFRVVRRTLPS